MVDVRNFDVLVADGSPAMRALLVKLLEADPQIRVVGAVGDGHAAVEFVHRAKPDLVLMDADMPRLGGFEATRRIMETHALPIVVCSAATTIKDVVTTFRAMEAGAVACISKPFGPGHADFAATAAHLVETVRLMSEVRVVRRVSRFATATLPPPSPATGRRHAPGGKVICIGASTGGPPALQSILSGLPRNFAAPVLVVQHISNGFLPGMVEWLNQGSAIRAQIATHGTTPLPGNAYLAPDDFHLGIGNSGAIALSRDEPEHHLRPAVSYLFRSLAGVYGPNALGVLLTGMGRDGAAELKLMRDQGAITIAQDLQSSVVHGMPGAAIAMGAATHVLPADKIAAALIELVNR